MEQISPPGATLPPQHAAAQRSLNGILAIAVLTAVHHYWRMGWITVLLGLLAGGIPTALLLWYRRGRSPVALTGYAISAGWVVIGFGFIDGLWDSTLKLFLGNFLLQRYGTYFSWQPVGGFGFEATGVLASVASLYAGFWLVRFVRYALRPLKDVHGPRAGWLVALGALVPLAFVTSAFLWRHQPPSGTEVAAGKVVKIGVIVPDNPSMDLLGDSFLKAAQMAMGDVQGQTRRHTYELVVERSSITNPLRTKAAIQKLITVDGVKAIVGGISLSGEVVAPYARAARIPHVCVCSVLSIGDGQYNFTVISIPSADAAAWTKEAERRGIHSVALLTSAYPSIDGHVSALRQELAARHIKVVYESRFEMGTTDFSAIAAQAKAARPDTFFVESMTPALDRVAAALRAEGVRNISSFVTPSLSDKPALFEGAWYVDTQLADLAFAQRFERRYPGIRFATHMMPFAYDAVRLIVNGFESEAGPVAYLNALRSYESAAGTVIKEPGSGNFRPKPAIWEIRNGRPQQLHPSQTQ